MNVCLAGAGGSRLLVFKPLAHAAHAGATSVSRCKRDVSSHEPSDWTF